MTDIPEVTPYVHPSTKQCNYVYTHPSTKQCNYSYTHPTAKQCSWNPSGTWSLLRDQTYTGNSINFEYTHTVSSAIDLTNKCGIACRLSGTFQILTASTYMARIQVTGIPYEYGFFNGNATTIGTYNIDVTNASFFQSAHCVTSNYNGVSLDPYINSGNVATTRDPTSTYGKLTITTGNVQRSMTVTYNLRQQVWSFSLS